MGRIALRDYLNQIANLIDESRMDEAAAHCRNILEQHPRHLETYRLLGRILLEQQAADEAADIFQRVLSVDPADLISHAGLASIFSESGDLPRAIWHMERAFEIDPYNRAIQVELTDLYARHDEEPIDQIDISRAALARLYLRGSLYDLAAREVRTLLSEQPERIDLKVMLAEILFRDHRRKEAAEVAAEVSRQLPLNITTNAILAAVWTSSSRRDEGRKHLMRLLSTVQPEEADLADDTIVALALDEVGGKQLPSHVLVEESDYIPVAGMGFEDSAEWRQDLDGDISSAEDTPDWLREYSEGSDPTAGDSNRHATEGTVDTRSTDPNPSDISTEPGDREEIEEPSAAELDDQSSIEGSDQHTGEPEMEGVPESIGQADELSEFRLWKTLATAGGVARAAQRKGHPEEPKEQGTEDQDDPEEESSVQSHTEGLEISSPPGERAVTGIDSAGGDPSSGVTSEWIDELADSPSDITEPPEWLAEVIGIEVASRNIDEHAGSDEDEDLDSETNGVKAVHAGEDTPEWLSQTVGLESDVPDADGSHKSTMEESDYDEPDESQYSAPVDPIAAPIEPADSEDRDGPTLPDSSAESMEDAMKGALEDPEKSQDDAQDDMSSEMEWLEELAASQDISDEAISGSASDLDSLEALALEDDYVPDWLKADVSDSEAQIEPDGTEATAISDEEGLGEEGEGQTLPSQEVPDWLQAQIDEETPSEPEEEAEDLDWFSQIEAGDEGAIDELLSVKTDEDVPEEETAVSDVDEDQPSWLLELEKLNQAQVEGIGEETPFDDSLSPAVEAETDVQEPIDPFVDFEEPTFIDSEEGALDPEEAMAFLEQMALEHGIVGEDEPVIDDSAGAEVTDEQDREQERERAPEDINDLATSVPEDPDEAMAWLERLAAGQEVSADEVVSIEEVGEDEQIVEIQETPGDDELELALTGLDDVAMPTDQAEALYWLEELASGAEPESAEPVHAVVDEMVISSPEDDSIQETSEEVAATEDELSGDGAVVVESPDVQPDSEMDEDLDALVREIDIAAEGEEISAPEDAEIVSGPEYEQAQPASVESGTETGEDKDDLAWLDSLDEANVTGWLESEEALLSETPPPDDQPTQPPAAAYAAPEIVTDQDLDVLEKKDQEMQVEELDSTKLESARTALESGEIDTATAEYAALIKAGESLPLVISDLESAVQTHGDQPALKHLLGDAYHRNGQLQEAIEIYRQALNNL